MILNDSSLTDQHRSIDLNDHIINILSEQQELNLIGPRIKPDNEANRSSNVFK